MKMKRETNGSRQQTKKKDDSKEMEKKGDEIASNREKT